MRNYRYTVVFLALWAGIYGAAALADEYVIDGETLYSFDWTQHSCNSLTECATAIEGMCAAHGGGRSSALAAQTNPEYYKDQCEGRCKDGHSVTIKCATAKPPKEVPKGPETNY